jgi:hypothetical protein
MRAAGADALTPLKSAMSICLFLFQTRSLSTASKATSKASPIKQQLDRQDSQTCVGPGPLKNTVMLATPRAWAQPLP